MSTPSTNTQLLLLIKQLSTPPFDATQACERLAEISKLVTRELDILAIVNRPGVEVSVGHVQWYKSEDISH